MINMAQFFIDHRCPNCGHDRFWFHEDGGHDVVLECAGCRMRYGLQDAPFNLIECVSDSGNILARDPSR